MTGRKKSVYLPVHLVDFLDKKSEEDGVSTSRIIQMALEDYMNRDPTGIEMKLDTIKKEEEKMRKEKEELRQKHQEAIERKERMEKANRLIQAGEI